MKKLLFLLATLLCGFATTYAQTENEMDFNPDMFQGQFGGNHRRPDGMRRRQGMRGRGDRPMRNGMRRRVPVQIDSARVAPFMKMEMPIDDQLVRYRAAVNWNADGSPLALVVYLHGRSGSGDDNLSQMGHEAIYSIYDYLKAHHVNAVLVVPQCPEQFSWAGVTGRDGEVRAKPFNPYVKALIDSCVTAMGIDRSRIYLLGASMGAQGVWKMLEDNPGTFAAAFCASGSGRDLSIKNLEKTPVYITRGSEERDRRGEGISELVAKINENGGEAKFELLEGMNHPQATREAFTEERLQWVFSHVRGTEE